MASHPLLPLPTPIRRGVSSSRMTTPPECANKLSPRWKGLFRVCRIPNDHQIVYEDGEVWWSYPCKSCKTSKIHDPRSTRACASSWGPSPSIWIFALRSSWTSSSSSCISCTCRGFLLLSHNSITRCTASHSCWERDATARNLASQSAARAHSSSAAISQTQPWAWLRVHSKKPTRKPTSPVWKSSQDGQDLSVDCAL